MMRFLGLCVILQHVMVPTTYGRGMRQIAHKKGKNLMNCNTPNAPSGFLIGNKEEPFK